MRNKLLYLFGYSAGFAVETGVITTAIYHVNKFVVWVGLGGKPMVFFEAFWIGLAAVSLVEIFALLKGRKANA